MTISTRTTLASLTALTLLATVPAHAATSQEDVQTCRTAMTERSNVNMDEYRLRFEYVKGNNQGRTVYLKVIPNTKKGTAFRVSCALNKNEVIALNTKSRIRFAQR